MRRYAVWLVLATVAAAAGALAVHALLPVRYVSAAKVDVESRLEESLTPITPNMGTEVQVATSGVVLDGAARALHMTPRELARDVTATATATGTTATGTANILAIKCTMPAPAAAQSCATAVTGAYLVFRNMAGAPAPAQLHDPLRVTLITAATRPPAPAGPSLPLLLPVGALLGLAAGAGIMLVRDRLDHRVRDQGDLEQCLSAPVLASIPYTRRPSLSICSDRLSPGAEAFRYLREHLRPILRAAGPGGAVLLVAGANAREGRTHVAANLAAAFAEAGSAVILLDADLEHPSLGEAFGTGAGPGLADLLAGAASVEETVIPVPDAPGLSVVAAGHRADRPYSLQAPQLARIFREMRTRADVVVVDSAPALALSQALVLASVSDLVIMVADVRRTGRGAVSAAADQIQALEPRRIIGVLNAVRSPGNGQAWRSVPKQAIVPRPAEPVLLGSGQSGSSADGQRDAVTLSRNGAQMSAEPNAPQVTKNG